MKHPKTKMIYPRFMSVVVLVLCAFSISHGQVKQVKSDVLLNIKRKYQQINEYKNYDTDTISNVEDFLGQLTDNGGMLISYFMGDSLKKIVEKIGLSDKTIQNEFYFDNDKLVFVYSSENRFPYSDKLQGLDYTKMVNVFQGRYYFENGKLIEAVFSDKSHAATGPATFDRTLR